MEINKVAIITGTASFLAGAGTVAIIAVRKVSKLKEQLSSLQMEKVKLETEIKFSRKGNNFKNEVKEKEIDVDAPDFSGVGKLDRKQISDEELNERLDNF